MKIIRIVPFLDFGGVEQRLNHTVKGFKSIQNISILTIVLGNGGRISKELLQLGYDVIVLDSSVKIPNLNLITKLQKLLKEHQPDVVHTSGAEANFHGLVAAWLVGVQVRIGEEIGFPNHDRKWKLIFKIIYTLATKVIGISESVKNRIVELGEVNPNKVEVVYNPVSIKESLERVTIDPGNDFVFVTTCRLVPIKNLSTLLAVFKELVSKDLNKEMKLWIVGDGPEKEKLEKQVIDFGLNDKVVFCGFQEDVIPYLEAANVFVLPSLSEGFSISLVEAMLCGLPCIVTNQGGPAEIIEDQITGFLINPFKPDQIQKTMQHLIDLPSKDRHQIGHYAKQAASKYSVENYIKRLMEVYGFNLPPQSPI